MTSDSRDIIDQAIAWHLREPSMVAADWHALVEWLEADPAHARAYDRVVLTMRLADDLPASAGPVAANSEPVAPRWPLLRRRLVFGGGAAMAAVLALLLVQVPKAGDVADRLVVTDPGAPRNLTLADGTLIELNGASRLRIDGGNPRRVAVEVGEAVFHVHHDSRAPFIVRSGEMSIEDVGTVFNVMRSAGRVDVAVAEGEVAFRHGGETIAVTAGEALSARDGAAGAVLAAVPVESVASWRGGRLSFAAEPVSRLAEAIRRRYGTEIALSPQLASLPFAGMMTLTGDANRDIPHVAALIGARYRKDGDRWLLSLPSQKQD